jgi:hypothetical protein
VQYGERSVAIGESLRRRLPPAAHATLLPRLLEAALGPQAAAPRVHAAQLEVVAAERVAVMPLMRAASEVSEAALWCRTRGVCGGGNLLHRLHVHVSRDHVRVASAIQTPE